MPPLKELPFEAKILPRTHLHLLFAPRLITRLKSQQAPKGKVQSATHEEVCYTPKELLDFSNLCRQKS